MQKIEDLRLNRYEKSPTPQLSSIRVEGVVLEEEDHSGLPPTPPAWQSGNQEKPRDLARISQSHGVRQPIALRLCKLSQ
jgi:hypothetical protein